MRPAARTKFIAFLRASGAEVVTPLTEWEIARWFHNGRAHVLYRNKREEISFSGPDAERLYSAFFQGKAPEARIKRTSRKSVEARLRVRDGDDCFFCGRPLREDDVSVEHLLSIVDGGNNHDSNLALAHVACNGLAGNMAIVDKIKLRERLRRDAFEGL